MSNELMIGKIYLMKDVFEMETEDYTSWCISVISKTNVDPETQSEYYGNIKYQILRMLNKSEGITLTLFQNTIGKRVHFEIDDPEMPASPFTFIGSAGIVAGAIFDPVYTYQGISAAEAKLLMEIKMMH